MEKRFCLGIGIAALVSAAVMGCSSDTSAEPDLGGSVAARQFWNVFEESRYADIPSVTAMLESALTEQPGDPELTLLLAHSNLWRLAEIGRDQAPDVSMIPTLSAATVSGFSAAATLSPDDTRIPCWLGGALLGAGRAAGNAEMTNQGIAQIERSVSLFPEFASFCEMIAFAAAPPNSPEFARAVNAVWRTLDTCYETDVDRKNPDVAPFRDRETVEGPKRVCWNPPKAVHNYEGFWLWAGDILARAGQSAVATVMYENAKALPSWSSWNYREELEARLADVAGRSALYVDEDPDNDPPVGIANAACTGCHAD